MASLVRWHFFFQIVTLALLVRFAATAAEPETVAGSNPEPDSQPLSPAQSLAKIHVRDGYIVELAAAEPLTLDPVAIDWDVAGRMWVVEMADYPLGMDGKGKPGGRVRVLDDDDADGRYDRATLFADGLNFPNGLLTWRDGVLVTAAPDILFLKDTDGDGKADVREVLFTGFQQGNQQLRANGLRWGLDNWVYCASGGHHGNYGVDLKIRSLKTGQETLIGSRDFRIRPDTGEIEPQSGPAQFGRSRDDWGHWFGTQNSSPLWHYVLGDHYLKRNPHVPAPSPINQLMLPLNPKVYPASKQEKRYHSFEQGGHFTSGCSGMVYRDDLLFSRNEQHVFACEPFHNLVHHEVMTEEDVSFRAHRDPAEAASEFFASEDRWCRPVMVRTGPDGALWVVDMYRYMIEHPDWLPEAGRKELLPHYRLGDDKGRIYRVLPAQRKTARVPRLSTLVTDNLVAVLDSSNGWQRDKAQQLLLWRSDAAAIPALQKLVRDGATAQGRLHALCTLDGLQALRPQDLLQAFRDDAPGVRENAVRLAENNATPEVKSAVYQLVNDADAKLRLQLAFTLGAWDEPAAGEALGRLAVANYKSPFVLAAVMSSALPHSKELVQAVAANPDARKAFLKPLLTLGLAVKERDVLATLLTPTLIAEQKDFSISQMQEAAQFLELLVKRQLSLEKLSEATEPDSLSRQLPHWQAMFRQARIVALDESRAPEERIQAVALLARHPARRPAALELLTAWLAPRFPAELQLAALRELAATSDESVPQIVLARWVSFGPQARGMALETLLSRETWALELLQAVQKGLVTPNSFDPNRQAQLRRHSSKRVRALAESLFSPVMNRATVVAEFRPALSLQGNMPRGQEVFERLCSQCHRAGNIGRDVGPDLQAVREHSPEKLLLNILDPNADVQPGFAAYTCTLPDGEELYGLITAETANSLVFKLTDGTARTVLRSQIKNLQGSTVSLMPEGLEVGLDTQGMADLIRYLRERK